MMKTKSRIIWLLLLVTSAAFTLCIGCIFPENLQGQTWYTNIRPSMRTRTSVYFRRGVMKLQDEQTDTRRANFHIKERRCEKMVDVGKYVISFEPDYTEYACIVFVNRSDSIVQLKMSSRSNSISRYLCQEASLSLDPWLMVQYPAVRQTFTTCPFVGGYNLQIVYSDGVKHGCNLQDLPMRLESECHNGEGLTFDFRTSSCIGRMPMAILQKMLCVTHWRQDGDVMSVIRKFDSDELWCLRIPARSSFTQKIKMFLFTDMSCPKEDPSASGLHYFELSLQMTPHSSLCADEHTNCNNLPCTGRFVTQCLKTCGRCNPNIYPTLCDFPRRMRGDWIIHDTDGMRSVNISDTRFHVDQQGDFDCITFSDSPSRTSRKFTTVSFFNNGCRPRLACLALDRISPNSVGYALSQSKIWPMENYDQVGDTLCADDNFYGDPAPILDKYRTSSDVYKPIITASSNIERVPCSMTASYIFNASFQNDKSCNGSLFQDCNDPTRIRFAFNSCVNSDRYQDFACIGFVESKYWETITLLQNEKDAYDTRCIIFSKISPDRVLVLPSAECDKLSFSYVNVGFRTAILDMAVTAEDTLCKVITTTTTHGPEPVNDAWSNDYKTKGYIDADEMYKRVILERQYQDSKRKLHGNETEPKHKYNTEIKDGTHSGGNPSVYQYKALHYSFASFILSLHLNHFLLTYL